MRYLSDLVGNDVRCELSREQWGQVDITGITADSRKVRPGYVFVAIRGVHMDGRDFIEKAIHHGAAAIVTDSLPEHIQTHKVPVLFSSNPRHTLTVMASQFYPRQPKWMVAVTGTDGKTSVANFYQQLWELMGEESASIGTLGVVSSVEMDALPAINTTPDPILLHKTLDQLVMLRVNYVAMEASSHGLVQHRLDGVNVQVAGFTNFTRDHLDYHKTEEAYFEAKQRLFSRIMKGGVAVLNADDPRFAELEETCREKGHKVISYGKAGKQLKLLDVKPGTTSQHVICAIDGVEHAIDVPLVGYFQVMNILCACGMALASGAEIDDLLAAIPKLQGVPGRMQLVASTEDDAAVYVDYAHTPGGLEGVLTHIRPHATGKLHVVFGCGGDRDRGKRPLMGEVACRLADAVYVTDDNPRSENPLLIRRDILKACDKAVEVEGRKAAIEQAVAALKAGDVLVIAGKGHEQGQTIGNVTHPFNDVEVAREAVHNLKSRR